MFERELTLYKFNLNYLRLLTADIDESQLGVAPFRRKPAGVDSGASGGGDPLGGAAPGSEPVCPPQWRKQFAPGSKPSELQAPLPSKSKLWRRSKTAIDASPRQPPRRPAT